jgi:hypothetical protein
MTEMDLPGGATGPCQNCGYWGHEHEKTRVFSENGRWHWTYECPDDPDAEPLVGRFVDRIGRRTADFVETLSPDDEGDDGGSR